MAAPQFLRANVGDLVGVDALPVMEELFRSSYNQHPMRRDALFKKVSTETSIWQYTELHDLPIHSAVAEGEDYTMNRMKQGYDVTLTPVKYGLGVSFSEELIEDGKFDVISDSMRKMGKSARESQEQAGMDILNNGFSGGTAVGDGLDLFHAAHTTPTGTYTFRNKPSAAADLTQSSLATAVADFEKVFVGDSGIKYNIKPKFLVVHSDNRLNAKALIGSDLIPGSANNDINALKDEGLIVISSPHLSDLDAWFLISAPEDNGLRIVSRKPVETKAAGQDMGWLNDAIYFKSRFREKVGAVHAYGVYGNAGA